MYVNVTPSDENQLAAFPIVPTNHTEREHL